MPVWPTWIGSGVVPQTSDTKRLLLAKVLGSLQNMSVSPDPALNPLPHDTIRVLRVKILKARAQYQLSGAGPYLLDPSGDVIVDPSGHPLQGVIPS